MPDNYYYNPAIPLPHFRDQGSFVTAPESILNYPEILAAKIPGSDLIQGLLAFDNNSLGANERGTLLQKIKDDHLGCEIVSCQDAVLRPTEGQDNLSPLRLFYAHKKNSGAAIFATPNDMVGKALLVFEIDTNRSGRTSFMVLPAEMENISHRLPSVIRQGIRLGGVKAGRYETEPIFVGMTAASTIPTTDLTAEPTVYEAQLHYQTKFTENQEATASIPKRFYQTAVFTLCQPGVYLALGDFALFMHSGLPQAVVSAVCGVGASCISVRNSLPFLREIWQGHIHDINPLRLMDRMWVTSSQWRPQPNFSLNHPIPSQVKAFLGKHADLIIVSIGAFACGGISLGLGLIGGMSVATAAPAIMGAMFGAGTLIGAFRTHLKTDEPLQKIFRTGLPGRLVQWLDKPESFQRRIFRFFTNPTSLLGIGYFAAGAFGMTGFGLENMANLSPVNLAMLAISGVSTVAIASRIVAHEMRGQTFFQGEEQMRMAVGVIGPLAAASFLTNPAAGLALFSHFWGETIYGVQEGVAAPYQRIQNRLDIRENLDRNPPQSPQKQGPNVQLKNDLKPRASTSDQNNEPGLSRNNGFGFSSLATLWKAGCGMCRRLMPSRRHSPLRNLTTHCEP